jgi:hypothetical protein
MNLRTASTLPIRELETKEFPKSHVESRRRGVLSGPNPYSQSAQISLAVACSTQSCAACYVLTGF